MPSRKQKSLSSMQTGAARQLRELKKTMKFEKRPFHLHPIQFSEEAFEWHRSSLQNRDQYPADSDIVMWYLDVQHEYFNEVKAEVTDKSKYIPRYPTAENMEIPIDNNIPGPSSALKPVTKKRATSNPKNDFLHVVPKVSKVSGGENEKSLPLNDEDLQSDNLTKTVPDFSSKDADVENEKEANIPAHKGTRKNPPQSPSSDSKGFTDTCGSRNIRKNSQNLEDTNKTHQNKKLTCSYPGHPKLNKHPIPPIKDVPDSWLADISSDSDEDTNENLCPQPKNESSNSPKFSSDDDNEDDNKNLMPKVQNNTSSSPKLPTEDCDDPNNEKNIPEAETSSENANDSSSEGSDDEIPLSTSEPLLPNNMNASAPDFEESSSAGVPEKENAVLQPENVVEKALAFLGEDLHAKVPWMDIATNFNDLTAGLEAANRALNLQGANRSNAAQVADEGLDDILDLDYGEGLTDFAALFR